MGSCRFEPVLTKGSTILALKSLPMKILSIDVIVLTLMEDEHHQPARCKLFVAFALSILFEVSQGESKN